MTPQHLPKHNDKNDNSLMLRRLKRNLTVQLWILQAYIFT